MLGFCSKRTEQIPQNAYCYFIIILDAGFFGGTESGLSLLEYLPAPFAGATAEERCFIAGAAVSPSPYKPVLSSSPFSLLSSNTLENTNFSSSLSPPSLAQNVKQQQQGKEGEATCNKHNPSNSSINTNKHHQSPISPFPAAAAAPNGHTTAAAAAAVERSGSAFKLLKSFEYFMSEEGGGSMGEFSHQSAVQTLQDISSLPDKENNEKLMTWGLCYPFYEKRDTLMVRNKMQIIFYFNLELPDEKNFLFLFFSVSC